MKTFNQHNVPDWPETDHEGLTEAEWDEASRFDLRRAAEVARCAAAVFDGEGD